MSKKRLVPRIPPHITVILAFLILTMGTLPAKERILNFDSRITVQKNGDLEVTETLRVVAEGNDIKRGIYRDFPTLYRGRFGLKSSVPFNVLEATRNGRPETWRVENKGNGVRVYLGNPDVFLAPGEHTYVIRYRTGRQLGFFSDFDELYWNVTGNGWAFPIERASATVELPPGARQKSVEAYTGPQGSQAQAWREIPSGSTVKIVTTAPLAPEEGLTIVVTWPKGFVTPPSDVEQWLQLFRDNNGIVLGFGGLLLALIYFLVVWAIHGRDPRKGVIIPRYEPPPGFGPAAVRYLRGMGTLDDCSFAASVIDLAVQGAVTIKESESGTYQLKKVSSMKSILPPPGPAVMEALMGRATGFVFKQTNHKSIKNAREAIAKAVSAQCDSIYFVKNIHLWVIGLLVTLVPLAVSLFDSKEPFSALFLLVWLGFWSIGVAGLSMQVVSSWRQSGWKKIAAIPITLFAIPFYAGWVFGAVMLVMVTSPWVAGCYVAGIAMTLLFHHLLKRPTDSGREALDDIEGFRQYLRVAEADRLNLENPPERTPALFEKFLPYALALDVEHEWSRQFTDVLKAAEFSPSWYQGKNLATVGAVGFASSMSRSFTSAISSSSTAPGSSSGSGGGGSSGGGGGGGGGGGW
ncbi:MAG: DUF2207 domain-containing protein [Terrimicrobiaceae bacterium]